MRGKTIGIMAVLGVTLAVVVYLPNAVHTAHAASAACGSGANSVTAGASCAADTTSRSAAGGGNALCDALVLVIPGGCSSHLLKKVCIYT